jgi:hypothetical protein
LAQRVKRILNTKVFKVLATTMDGMDHLLPGSTPLDSQAAEALAEKLGLASYQLDHAGVNRLSRVAAILKENPDVVNPKLGRNDAKHYW